MWWTYSPPESHPAIHSAHREVHPRVDHHLDTKRSWTQALARLAKIYATS